MTSNYQISLKLDLVEEIPAVKLADLLDSMEKIYFFNLWLDLAKENKTGDVFPDIYSYRGPEYLWIENLEIGTPNWLKLKGLKNQVVALAAFVVAVSSGPQAITDVIKSSIEIEKIKAETYLIEEEIKSKQQDYILKSLDIVQKASELKKEGKISEEAFEHKVQSMEEIKAKIMNGKTLIKSDSIRLEHE